MWEHTVSVSTQLCNAPGENEQLGIQIEGNLWVMQVQSPDHLKKEEPNKPLKVRPIISIFGDSNCQRKMSGKS